MQLVEIEKKDSRNEFVLPQFQREFVWNEEKKLVDFVNSVFNKWPIGSIILWSPNPEDEEMMKRRDLETSSQGKPVYQHEYIIDGQQRITTLIRILRNESFIFRGKEKKLYYDFKSRKFRFIEKNKLNQYTISVGKIIKSDRKELKSNLDKKFIKKLPYDIDDTIDNIKKLKDYDITIQRTGESLSLENALELFIQLNTGGKHLPSVDLALAYISLLWEDSREEFKRFRNSLTRTGFHFDFDFFVRCLSAVSLKQSLTKKLISSFKVDLIKKDWEITKNGIENTIDFLKSPLNLGSNLFLEAQNTLVPVVLLFSKKERMVENKRDLLAYWFIVSYINQRFSGQSTAVLNKDINTILESNNPIEDLIRNLDEDGCHFRIPLHQIKGRQFKFVLYCLFKSLKTRDFVSGVGIDSLAASKSHKLDFHHIFADSILKKTKFKEKKEEIANKTFLTNRSNKKLSDSDPTYLSEYREEFLKAHFIPIDKDLWKLEKYEEFLEERKKLISEELNKFLHELKSSSR